MLHPIFMLRCPEAIMHAMLQPVCKDFCHAGNGFKQYCNNILQVAATIVNNCCSCMQWLCNIALICCPCDISLKFVEISLAIMHAMLRPVFKVEITMAILHAMSHPLGPPSMEIACSIRFCYNWVMAQCNRTQIIVYM